MNAISKFWLKLRKKAGAPRLLCDTCKYDYGRVCLNPKRPNATVCDEYKRR
ncbi:MAG: hypothetical protein KKF41_03160 [Actinobacteria bacterium]|nr:hypothetical protein [Actinomycetota bacterium]MBU1943314.1 hypothetical protein [Actinomycetota bacterium]MBU2686568.1 hypothetical protein [Actinomycetota bacterium]